MSDLFELHAEIHAPAERCDVLHCSKDAECTIYMAREGSNTTYQVRRCGDHAAKVIALWAQIGGMEKAELVVTPIAAPAAWPMRVGLFMCALLAMLTACQSTTAPAEPLWCVRVGHATSADGLLIASAWASPIPGFNCVMPKGAH